MDKSITSAGTCLTCHYDLRGLERFVCPECGRLFDPGDPSTVGPAGRVCFGFASKWAMEPVGWPVWLVTVALSLAIVGYARFPVNVRDSTTFYRYLWPALVTLWGGRFLVQFCMRLRILADCDRQRIPRAPAIFMLCQICVLAMIVHSEIVFRVAMKLSVPAMNRLIDPMEAVGKDNSRAPRWVGVYRVGMAQHGLGAVQLWSADVDATFLRFDGEQWHCNLGQIFWHLI